jgi:hypothetical protein
MGLSRRGQHCANNSAGDNEDSLGRLASDDDRLPGPVFDLIGDLQHARKVLLGEMLTNSNLFSRDTYVWTVVISHIVPLYSVCIIAGGCLVVHL